MLAVMEKNREVIESDIVALVYYMQGGIDYNDAWLLTDSQRKKMARVIEKHFEAMSGNKNNKF